MSSDVGLMQNGNPSPGSPVTLLSQNEGVSYDATVRTWDSGETGLVVTTRVDLTPDAVRDLADHRVWVSVPLPDQGFTVFGGIAHPAGESSLEITGVVPLVREQRRRSPRTEATAQVTVAPRDRAPMRLAALDLSRGGVRVVLGDRRDLTLGEHVAIEVQLEDGTAVPATGEVTRVDLHAGHAVVRFERLPSDTGDHIDRYVLFRLTHP